MSVAGAIVGGIVDSSGVVGGGVTESDGDARYERIVNGGFANGASWTIANTTWQITGGHAETLSSAGGNGLNQSFVEVAAGKTLAVTFDVANAPTPLLLTVKLTSSGTPVQTIYFDGPSGAVSISVVATNSFDGIRFETPSTDNGLELDNVSLIA